MRLRRGTNVLVSLTDGTVIRGRVIRSWRWHVIRLTNAEVLTAGGVIPAAGDTLIPWRSILLAQEVRDE